MPLRRDAERAVRAVYRRLPSRYQEGAKRVWRRHPRLFAPTQPLLSVVMPVYNVEAYLAEAVESVLLQNYINLELILINDGSLDNSGAICDAFARQDKRVRVIHKANGGLGAARNTGTAAARGSLITFADSDDYVLPSAYKRLIGAMRLSGSDVATGNVRRRHGKRTYQAWNQSRSHVRDLSGVTLHNHPELLFDTVAWNKVFRTEFYREHVKSFPVNKWYEDMLPMFTAFLYARSIDVLSTPVYVWRLRDEGDSITQRLLEPRNIDDRMEMIGEIRSLIHAHGFDDTLGDRLVRKVLEGDLWIYVRDIDGASDEMIDRICAAIRAHWSTASDAEKLSIPAERRICYWLLEQGRGQEVVPFQQWYASVNTAPPIVRGGASLLLEASASPVPLDGIPAINLDMSFSAVGVANTTRIEWTGPTELTVSGYAYTRFVSDGSQEITITATNSDTKAALRLPTRRQPNVDGALWAWDKAVAHTHDGFSCAIDVAALVAAPPRRPLPTDAAVTGTDESSEGWRFGIRVTDGAISRTMALDSIWRGGSAAVAGSRVLPDGTVATVKTDPGEPMRIVFDDSRVVAASFDVTGDTVRVSFAPDAHVSKVTLAKNGHLPHVIAERQEDGTFLARLPSNQRTREVWWRLRATVQRHHHHHDHHDHHHDHHDHHHHHEVAVVAPRGFEHGSEPNPAGLRAAADASGNAVVRAHARTALVTRLDCGPDGEIRLAGSLLALDTFEIGIALATMLPTTWHRVRATSGRFDAEVPVTRPDAYGTVRPLPAGEYRLYARRRSQSGSSAEAVLLMHDSVGVELPTTHLRDAVKVKLSRAPRARVAVDVAAPIPDEQAGKYAQEQLINRWQTTDRQLEAAVFFCVDLGSNAGDSARAIHDELRRRDSALRLYWGVVDHSVSVPDGGIPVIKLSPEWYEKLNTSRYIVNNYGGVWGLSKHPQQRYLQTWHGTPLKYIGASEARQRNASSSRFDNIAHESAEWDGFVSPSPYFTSLLPTDFFYHGSILETGYPRNDRLANSTDAERDVLRDRLGLRRSAKVLLYAPTYREGQRSGWKAALYDGLNVSRLLNLLGRDWYVLLRGHSFNARADRTDRSAGRLVDVTQYPDINDLYLASDALLTDYSSVMFDYAVTGRPMLFFTPDLKQYMAARGTYFDLEQAAPGPLYSEVGPLAAGLRDLDKLAVRYRDRYAAFVTRFAPWDDGKAAARVVDAFFE
jgi:CDP-glycerol glycerophosphotransferase